MYASVLPSYNSKEDRKNYKDKEKINADDVRNKDRILNIFKNAK
jgi:hypothetical protein